MSLLIPRSPAPWDVLFTVGGVRTGWMLARGRGGQPLYRETPQDVAAGVSVAPQLSHLWRDFFGGVGLRTYVTGDERQLYDVDAAATFGGVDASVEGALILPGKMRTVAVYAGAHTVRAFARFNDKYYAAIDDRVYESTNGLFTDATDTGAPTGCNYLDLIAFRGNNAQDLLWLARDGGSAYTWDGTTFAQVGLDANATLGYIRHPTLFAKTTDGGANYTDYTAAVSDSDTGTGADLSSLDTVANGDWAVLAYSEPFIGAEVGVAVANGNVADLTAEFWDGSAWTAMTITLDDTASGGKTLGVVDTKSVRWGRPAGWAKAQLTATGNTAAAYFVRLGVTAALDSSVTLHQVLPVVYSEAAAWAVRGKDLGRIFDRNRLGVSEDGGVAPDWDDQPDPAGDYQGDPVGLVATQDAWYFKSTTGFHSWAADGTPVSYLPDLADSPDTSTTRAFTSWAGLVWFAHGAGFWRFDPVSGTPAPWGPETLGAVDRPPTMTTAVGDRAFCLYCAGLDADGATSWLWKYGGADANGRPRWYKEQKLGARTVGASAAWDVAGQPYLILGDDAGTVLYRKLAKTGNPLDANSGCDFQDNVDGYALLGTWQGHGQDSTLVARAVALAGRNLDLGVDVSTRAPDEASAWTLQGTTTEAGRLTFAATYSGLGIDQRLTLSTADSSKTPQVTGYWLYWHQAPRRLLTIYSMTLELEAGGAGIAWARDRGGAPFRGTTGDSLTAAFDADAFTLTLPGGETDIVRCQSWQIVGLPTPRGQRMRLGAQVVLSTVG